MVLASARANPWSANYQPSTDSPRQLRGVCTVSPSWHTRDAVDSAFRPRALHSMSYPLPSATSGVVRTCCPTTIGGDPTSHPRKYRSGLAVEKLAAGRLRFGPNASQSAHRWRGTPNSSGLGESPLRRLREFRFYPDPGRRRRRRRRDVNALGRGGRTRTPTIVESVPPTPSPRINTTSS